MEDESRDVANPAAFAPFLRLEHVEHWERIASRWRPALSSHLVNGESKIKFRELVQFFQSPRSEWG